MSRLCGWFLLSAICLGCGVTTGAGAAKAPPAPIREPAVAGQFYPGDPRALGLSVDRFLRDALPAGEGAPLVLVAPHAGYIYSGQIAADAWRQAAGHGYELVVLLGTNHTAPGFSGVSVYPGGGFRTPLGVAEVDAEAAAALLAADPDCSAELSVHAREHSVEVQVPFVQRLFPAAKILPVVVGSPNLALCSRFGEALARAVRGKRALIVVSTDLSHYPNQQDADAVDRRVLAAVTTLEPAQVQAAIGAEMGRAVPGLSTCACGEAPLLAGLAAARALGALRSVVLSYANSGEVPIGEPGRVVGYGAVALFAGPPGADTRALAKPPLDDSAGGLEAADKRALLALARETLDRFLTTGTVPLPRGFSARARQPRGAFVTLKKGGELRGCIGSMALDRPLASVVAAMAIQAAVRDHRFPPVAPAELPGLELEISVLTPMQRVPGAHAIVVGRDGVLLEKDGRSAVFLPQVAAEQGWGRDEMLDALCRKAGLPPGAWRQGARFSTFRADVFREGEAI